MFVITNLSVALKTCTWLDTFDNNLTTRSPLVSHVAQPCARMKHPDFVLLLRRYGGQSVSSYWVLKIVFWFYLDRNCGWFTPVGRKAADREMNIFCPYEWVTHSLKKARHIGRRNWTTISPLFVLLALTLPNLSAGEFSKHWTNMRVNLVKSFISH